MRSGSGDGIELAAKGICTLCGGLISLCFCFVLIEKKRAIDAEGFRVRKRILGNRTLCFDVNYRLSNLQFRGIANFILFLIEVWLIYNGMLLSAVQQSDSLIYTYIKIYMF